MKIRAVTEEILPKALGLLKQAFPGGEYEPKLVEMLHRRNVFRLEWVCLHKNTVIGYIAFTSAYKGKEVCGLHLGPLAVKPDFQNQGIGTELMRFALRQQAIVDSTVFVLGDRHYYSRFGFLPCSEPVCPFDVKNRHFLALRNDVTSSFTVGYEKEFNGQDKFHAKVLR